LVPALVIGLAAVVGAWLLAAGSATPPAGRLVDVRRRLAVVGVTGTACGPLLLVQGTPVVNHPFLPGTLGVTHALAIGLLVVLGGTVALAVRAPKAAALCAVILVGPLAVFSAIPAEILLSIAGTSYPADGLSVLPGVALGTPFVVAALAKRAREPVSR
jgi:hypothetical protein